MSKKKSIKKASPKPIDMGVINGVKLTYYNGNVFATPTKEKDRLPPEPKK